jgi:hypothetical protein
MTPHGACGIALNAELQRQHWWQSASAPQQLTAIRQ